MKKYVLTIISVFSILVVSGQANSASFDCNKATTWTEKTICKNPELSKLDDAMVTKYKKKLSSKPEYEDIKVYKNNLIIDQQLWLNFQRNTCTDIQCLIREYREYVEEKTYDDWNDGLSPSNMPNKNVFGEFSKNFKISIYNAEFNRNDTQEAIDTLSINKVNNKPHLSVIESELIFDNLHSCSLEESIAIWSQNHWVIYDNNQGEETKLRLYPALYKGKNQLLLKDINGFSSGRCGVRGYFDGIILEHE